MPDEMQVLSDTPVLENESKTKSGKRAKKRKRLEDTTMYSPKLTEEQTVNMTSKAGIAKPKDEDKSIAEAIKGTQISQLPTSQDSQCPKPGSETKSKDKTVKKKKIMKEEEEEDSEEDVEKYHCTMEELDSARKLDIYIDFEVPRLHELCSYRHGFRPHEKEEIEARNIPYLSLKNATQKRNQFSKLEDRILKNNWEQFSKFYDVQNPWPFISDRRSYIKENRQKFLQCMGKGLPLRPLHCVLYRLKLLFAPTRKTGPYRENETETMKRFIVHNGTQKMAELCPILRRSKESLWQHYYTKEMEDFRKSVEDKKFSS